MWDSKFGTTHSFNKYVLNFCLVPETIPILVATSGNKTKKFSFFKLESFKKTELGETASLPDFLSLPSKDSIHTHTHTDGEKRAEQKDNEKRSVLNG